MISSQDFILSLRNGEVSAAGPLPNLTEWPARLSIDGSQYLTLEDGDTFFFWDEIRNAAGLTVGYSFLLPESATFRNSQFIREACNVSLDGEWVTLLLEPCNEPVLECIQGFGSEILVNEGDRSDCVVFLTDFSENPRAFSTREWTENTS